MPAIECGATGDQWRTIWLLDVEAGRHWPLHQSQNGSLPVWNICEASWCGLDRLALIVLEGLKEGEWYSSKLVVVQVDSGVVDVIYQPQRQLSFPVGSPLGNHVAVIEGLASDRGCVAGDMLRVDMVKKTARRYDTNHVDIVCLAWGVEESLFVTGFRDLSMVAGIVHLLENKFEELWLTDGPPDTSNLKLLCLRNEYLP